MVLTVILAKKQLLNQALEFFIDLQKTLKKWFICTDFRWHEIKVIFLSGSLLKTTCVCYSGFHSGGYATGSAGHPDSSNHHASSCRVGYVNNSGGMSGETSGVRSDMNCGGMSGGMNDGRNGVMNDTGLGCKVGNGLHHCGCGGAGSGPVDHLHGRYHHH